MDAGFGRLVKAETEEVQTEWLKDEANFEEWMSGRINEIDHALLSADYGMDAHWVLVKK